MGSTRLVRRGDKNSLAVVAGQKQREIFAAQVFGGVRKMPCGALHASASAPGGKALIHGVLEGFVWVEDQSWHFDKSHVGEATVA